MKAVQRFVRLPAIDKSVPLGAYVKAVKLAKANPEMEFKHGLTCWWPCTGREIVKQFFEGVQERINAGVPYGARGL